MGRWVAGVGLGIAVAAAFPAMAQQAPSYYELQRRLGVTNIPGEKISFPSTTPLNAKELLAGGGKAETVEAYLQLPETAAGPVPAVVILNCGDTVKQFKELAYAEEMRHQGYAVLLVNSVANREDSGEPRAVFRLRYAAAVDALRALKVLAADKRIDPKRIAILGWANGGAAILTAVIEEVRAG